MEDEDVAVNNMLVLSKAVIVIGQFIYFRLRLRARARIIVFLITQNKFEVVFPLIFENRRDHKEKRSNIIIRRSKFNTPWRCRVLRVGRSICRRQTSACSPLASSMFDVHLFDVHLFILLIESVLAVSIFYLLNA